jgi:hypothetical protein
VHGARAPKSRFAQGGHLATRRPWPIRAITGSPMQLSPHEQSVVKAVAARRDGLVALTSELVAFDTVTHTAGAPPREERAQ